MNMKRNYAQKYSLPVRIFMFCAFCIEYVFEVSSVKNTSEVKMKLHANNGIEEYLLVDYKNKTIEQYYLNDNSYKFNKKYINEDICTLLLYPKISFVVNDVFKIFINE